MFCPECHCEYRDGFLQCADCDVALVATLIEPAIDEAPAEEHSWVGFSVPDATVLATARSVLEGSNIPFHVVDEFSRKNVPQIVVPQARSEDVEALLDELWRSIG